MLAARALADFYDVIVLERDDLEGGTAARRGVPQGRHVHALLARGGAAFEELFPGIGDELIDAGAVTGDVLADTTWCPHGHQLRNVPSGLRAISASRALIENTLRRRVAAMPRVTICSGTAAVELVAAADRVRGVRVRTTGTTGRAYIKADLIVDATGRGSRTPEWLNAIGFPRPAENRIAVQLRYASRTYRVPADVMRGRTALIHPSTPQRPRGALAQQIEGDQVRLSFLGYRGYEPVPTDDGLRAHAASLGIADMSRSSSGASRSTTSPATASTPTSGGATKPWNAFRPGWSSSAMRSAGSTRRTRRA